MAQLRTLVCGSLLALGATPAMTQSLPGGMYVEGEIALDQLFVGSDNETLAYGDVTLGGSFGAGSPFGFMLGFDVISFDNFTEEAFYGALTWSVGPGMVSVGVPRFVVDDYITAPNAGGTEFLTLVLPTLPLSGGSIARNLYLLEDDLDILGLRYDADYGALSVGASAHRVSVPNDIIAVLNFAGTYDLGDTDLMGAVEVITEDGSTRANTYLGATYGVGQFGAGVLYTNFQLPDALDALSIWGSYEIIPDLTATGTYQSILGEDFDIVGVDVEYSPGGTFYVRGGGIFGDPIGDDIYSVGVGYRF